MPKIIRQNLPRNLFEHLLQRIQERHISAQQLILLVTWLDGAPEVFRQANGSRNFLV
jgi:hypothetical protein